MLDRAELCGLGLPENWRERFPTDAFAPAVGTWRGWGKYFLYRSRRVIGTDPSESIHPTAFMARSLPKQHKWWDLVQDDAVATAELGTKTARAPG